MSDINSGVQKCIQDILPNAHFVHCCAHDLNLVICDCYKFRHRSMFLYYCTNSFQFFSSLALRWAL